jgi:CSLREA domain-containing protein
VLKRRRAGIATAAAIGATALFAPAAANAANFEVNSAGDSGGGTCTTAPDGCTLRDAVAAANGTTEDDAITFASSLSGQTITLAGTEIPIDATNYGLTIQGPGAANLTISGDSTNKSRIFNVSGNNHPVAISGLTLMNGYVANGDGGAIFTTSGTDVTVADSLLTGNQAHGTGGTNGNGGAIGADGKLTVTGSEFRENAAQNTNTTNNNTHGNGGGIAGFGQLSVSGSKFDTNTASQLGGGIFAYDGLTLRSSTLSGNTAGRGGGGISSAKYGNTTANEPLSRANISFPRSDLDIADSTISGNSASYAGGIEAASLLAMKNTTVTGNHAINGSGGGIQSFGKYAQTQISDSTISSNTAAVGGGGVQVFQFYKLESGAVKHAVKSEISGTTIEANTAPRGAGLHVTYLANGDHFTITSSTISGNDATSADRTGVGGGIRFGGKYREGSYNYSPIDGEFRTINTTISGNTADLGGGVSVGGVSESTVRAAAAGPDHHVIGKTGSVEFENSTIASNTAKAHGGGVYLAQYRSADDPNVFNSPTIALTSTIVADNTAGGAANDAERGATAQSGGLDTSFSLVENPGNAPITQSPGGSTLTGIDPLLGPLGNNGGLTKTQLPSTTSPVIDQGKAPARLLTDQRGLDRTVQGDVADARLGDGTDIGAAEVQNPAKNVVGQPITQPQLPGDETAPIIGLKVPKTLSIQQLIDGFNVTVSCNEPCSMTFRLFASAPTGTLHSAGYNFRLLNKKIGRKAGRRTVHLQPCIAGSKSRARTHVCRTRITKALFAKPQQTFRVKLIVAAKDKAGNVSHKKRFIRVHR